MRVLLCAAIAAIGLRQLDFVDADESSEPMERQCCRDVEDLRRRLAVVEAKLEALLDTSTAGEQSVRTGLLLNDTAGQLARKHECPPANATPDPVCASIQKTTWTSSWAAVAELDKVRWEKLGCACQLQVRSNVEEPVPTAGCEARGRPNSWEETGRDAVRALKDKYRGEKCVLVANGPSLNSIRWDWLPNFKVVMGMNKIYLGLERFNLSRYLNVYAVANPLVMQQSVEQIVAQLPLAAEKFVTLNNGSTALYPCDSSRRRIHFARSSFRRSFFTDIAEEAPAILCEGYTVTHYSLQVLYYLGCQTVYLVGLDHSFAQAGSPNQVQTLHGEDKNHFDKAYFGGGQQWHTADLRSSEHYYSVARQVYESDDRRIVDVTAGGKCTSFEKGDYREELYMSSSAQASAPVPMQLAELTTPLLFDAGRVVNLTVAVDANPWLPDTTARGQIASMLREQAFARRLRLGSTGLENVLQGVMGRLSRIRAAVAADDAATVAARAPHVVRAAEHIVLLGPADGTCGTVCWAALFSRAKMLCSQAAWPERLGVNAPATVGIPSRIAVFAASDTAVQQQIPPEITTEASKLAFSRCNISLTSIDRGAHSLGAQNRDGSSNNGTVDVVALFEDWSICTTTTPTRHCPPLHLTWADLKLNTILDNLGDMPDVVWLPSMAPRARPRLREIMTAKSAVKPGGLIWIERSLLQSVAPADASATVTEAATLEASFTSLIYNAGSKQPGNGPLQNLTESDTSKNEHIHVAAGFLYRRPSLLNQQLLWLTHADIESMRCTIASSSRARCDLVSLCTTQGHPASVANANSLPVERMEIQIAAIKAMAKLRSTGLIAKSTLLTESSEWAAEVERVSGGAITAVLLPEEGPPLLRTVLETAEANVLGLTKRHSFAGFMNGDILLDSTRLNWVVLLLQSAIRHRMLGPQVLVVARRTNVQTSGMELSMIIDDLAGLNAGTPLGFEQLLKTGSMMQDESAMDIFLWTGEQLSRDPTGPVPEFVVGRAEWDKWLLGRAINRGFSIVDATSLLAPVHLTGGDGNFASRRHDVGSSPTQQRNKALYAAAEADGTIDSCVRIACAQFAFEQVEGGDGWALQKRH
eukprot:COSAG02_NODE_2766_length_8067_cov_6.245733_9_plen_1097_part_00